MTYQDMASSASSPPCNGVTKSTSNHVTKIVMMWPKAREPCVLCLVTLLIRMMGPLFIRAHGGAQTYNICISRFFRFSRKLFGVTGTPMTYLKTCFKFWGLPRTRVWYGNSCENLMKFLAVVMILIPFSSVRGGSSRGRAWNEATKAEEPTVILLYVSLWGHLRIGSLMGPCDDSMGPCDDSMGPCKDATKAEEPIVILLYASLWSNFHIGSSMGPCDEVIMWWCDDVMM